jgi:hypothetical protein
MVSMKGRGERQKLIGNTGFNNWNFKYKSEYKSRLNTQCNLDIKTIMGYIINIAIILMAMRSWPFGKSSIY